MRRLFLALALLVSPAGCGAALESRSRESVAPRTPIVLEEVRGEAFALEDFDGPVVIFFFTTGSGPAQAIAPFVAAVARRLAPRGLSFVGVAVEPGQEAVVAAWAEYMALPFRIAVATPEQARGDWPLGPIPAVPSFAFLDRDKTFLGWDLRLLEERELERLARELLARTP